MDRKEFTTGTVKEMKPELYEMLKGRILGEYISFQIIDEKEITQLMFSEKICDYFEKLEIKTDKSFNKVVVSYVSDWDEIVKKNIPDVPSDKGEAVPRSRKFYDHTLQIKNSRNLTLKQLTDYSRIIMCLYMAIIDNKGKRIKDFDYSTKCLDLDKMIAEMKKEKVSAFPFGTKDKFNLSELYSTDTSTFIMTMIMYYFIKNNDITEEE